MQSKLENYTPMKKIFGILSACLLSLAAYAVVASPEPFEYTKADGTKVMARLHGDEFHSYIMSMDGELLEGTIDGIEEEQAIQMRRARRMPNGAGSRAFPVTGSPRSLVLLVGFSNMDFEQTQQNFQDLLTKSGYNHNGATGSCRDYYIASSDSIFSPQFDCYGPFKLSQTMEYYGANSGENHSIHANQMVSEACMMAHDAGVNFKDYDTDNDGVLDNVFIFYAGHNEAEGGGANTIWPHQSNISYMNVRLDNVLVGSYACTSEYKGSSSKTRCGIGTFCHEFGHVIGQPDFYDTNYNYYSVGAWDIMCSGSYNNGGNTPPTFSAYERMYEGWLKPKQLELPGQYTLSDIPFQKEAYLIAASTHNLSGAHPSPNEFFLLDYRSGANAWDAALPGNGMLVWHIDYSASAWTSNTPNNGPTLMRMHLEEANGIGWKKRSNGESGRPSDPFPGTQNVTTFNPVLHNGTQLAQPVFNITEAGGIISFTYIGQSGSTLKTSKEALELTTAISDNGSVVAWSPQSFELLGVGMAPESPITLKCNESRFFLHAGEDCPNIDSGWSNTILIHPNADSTVQQRIWVNFHPKKQKCTTTQSSVSISSVAASISLPITGNSPRPTYVTTPQTLSCESITPYSFTARWESVNDAERYYLTLFQIEKGETDFLQDFENFTSFDNIRNMGWQSNTTLTTASAKADGTRSLYIKNHGDQITTETYPAPISSISFWYNAFSSAIDTIGVLELEAYNGADWEMLDRLVISNKSKRTTAHYELSTANDYRAFRMTWVDNGGAGIAFDAFTATTSQKINYLHKGREISLMPGEKDIMTYTFTGLAPKNTYYYQVQCTDLDKGCEEHLTDLSDAVVISTLDGEPIDGKHLTLAIDSINYNPDQHAVYVMNPEEGDFLYFYSSDGRLVQTIPILEGMCVYSLKLGLYDRGAIYIIQHAKNGKLGRKNKWVKFVY